MAENPTADLVTQPVHGISPFPGSRFIVLYDGSCGFCQGWIARMKRLDSGRRTEAVPISEAALSALDPRLSLDDCMREIHVLTPGREIYSGWDAVARLLRLFPLTWLVGAIGALPLCRRLGRLGYRYVAAHRHAIRHCRIRT